MTFRFYSTKKPLSWQFFIGAPPTGRAPTP